MDFEIQTVLNEYRPYCIFSEKSNARLQSEKLNLLSTEFPGPFEAKDAQLSSVHMLDPLSGCQQKKQSF